MTDKPIPALVELGLTDLESKAYAFLVENSPATGYKVAKALAKPTANTYKALDSLSEKGAVLIDDGATRQYRAVGVNELLGSLETRFSRLKTEASHQLANLKPSDSDEKIYHLRTVEQVYGRVRQMLRGCSTAALLDLFPDQAQELADDLKETAERNVTVVVKVYQPIEIEGVHAVLAHDGQSTIDRWPGTWLNCVTDASEYLHAFLTGDGLGVNQAVWSNSTYLAFLYHSSLVFELRHAALLESMRAAKQTVRPTPLNQILAGPLISHAPGFQELCRRYNQPDSSESKTQG